MTEFKDRLASNLNKKVLKVDKVERNEAGEIEKLYVFVTRNDTPYQNAEGTPLNAANLNSIINEMINSKIKAALENYHVNGLAELENFEVVILLDNSATAYDTISISVSEAVRIVVENDYTEYFGVSSPTTSPAGTINIDIIAFQNPEFSGTTEFDFVIKLYSQETEEMIKKVTCTVILQEP